MQARKYYFRSTDGALRGPFSFNEVAEMVQAGKLKAVTQVSTNGETFQPMKALPELATLLSVGTDLRPSPTDLHPPTKDDLSGDAIANYSGDLQQVSILKVFYHFSAAQSTGRLRLLAGETSKDVFLSNGKPLHIISNQKEESFSQYLLKHRLCDPGKLEAMLREVARDEHLLPNALLKNQILSNEDLLAHLKGWVLILLYELFTWREGRYFFFEGQAHMRAPMPLNLSFFEVMTEGVRRGFEEDELRALLSPFLKCSLLSKDNAQLRVTDLNLSPAELKVFKAIGSGLCLAGILGQFPSAGAKTVLSMVYLGIELNLVGIGGEVGEVGELASPEAQDLPNDASAQGDEAVGEAEPPSQANSKPTATNGKVSPAAGRLLEVLDQVREKNFFERLGVDPAATTVQITKAFIKVAREFHPDQTAPDSGEQIVQLRSEIFALLNEAHQTLADESRRAEYVANLSAGHGQGQIDVSAIMRSEVTFQKGQALLKSLRFIDARRLFEEAISENPEEGEFLIYRAFAEFSASPNDPAVRTRCSEEIQKGLKLRDNNVANGFVFLGRIAQADGDLASAERHFKKALSIEKDNIEATRELRLMSMRSGKKGQPRR